MQFRALLRHHALGAVVTALAGTILTTGAVSAVSVTATPTPSGAAPGTDPKVTILTAAETPDAVRDYWTDTRLKTAGGEKDELDDTAATADGQILTPGGDKFGYGRPKQPYIRYGTRGVGKVVMVEDGEPSNCSASAIGGDLIVTAAHCIVGPTNDKPLTHVAFIPDFGARGAYKPFGLWPVTKTYMPTKYFETSGKGKGDFPSDVAVMRVAPDRQGASLQEAVRTYYKTIQSKTGVPLDKATDGTLPKGYAYGYPGTGGPKFKDGPEMFFCIGEYTDEKQKPVSQLNTSNCAAKGGNSGGPLFDKKWNVIGVAQSASSATSFSRLHPDTFGRALTEARNDHQ